MAGLGAFISFSVILPNGLAIWGTSLEKVFFPLEQGSEQ
jgi:hypothetical protein